MRSALVVFLLCSVPGALRAQEQTPPGFVELELERSRMCVVNLARMAEVNRTMEPLATRFDRLRLVAQGVALEDPAILDSLDAADPVEQAVQEWFAADSQLARRYVEEQDSALIGQRAAARQEINALVQEAATTVQAEARAILEAEPEVTEGAAACEGAILVRSAVLEACETVDDPICAAASATEPGSLFRFVDAPEDLWDLEQIRPWSDPAPLQVSPEGQLVGARTVASTRLGNVVLIAAVGPLLRDRSELTPEQIAGFEARLDSMGVTFEHPQLVFAPALDVQANLPQPLAGETAYVLHFGPITEADVVWTGPAGTGQPLRASVPLTPAHLALLRTGSPLSLAAMKGLGEGEPVMVMTMQVTPVGQPAVMSALMEYMSSQLSVDLARLLPGSE